VVKNGMALEIVTKEGKIIEVKENKTKLNNFFQPELLE